MDQNQIYVGKLFKRRADEFLNEGAAGKKIIDQTFDLLAKSYAKQQQWERDIVAAFPQLAGKRFDYNQAAGTITITGDIPAPPEVPQPDAEPDTAEPEPEPPCGGRIPADPPADLSPETSTEGAPNQANVHHNCSCPECLRIF